MRCLTRILVVLAVVAPAGRESRAGEPDVAELAALIDRHVETRLEAERVPPAEPADDAEFLRRVYLDLHGVVAALRQRRAGLHVVVTGRNAKPELTEAADLVTEMTLVKHHFAAGVKAQAGIEF